MNYDRMILELLERIQKLEDEVAILKMVGLEPTEAEADIDENIDEPTRKQARERAIAEIEKRFPDYLVRVAQRKDGGGILINTPNKKQPYSVKFYHSKEHERGSSWYTVKIDEIMDLSYCIFSYLDKNDKWSYFIFGTDELSEYRDTHRKDINDETLHLYFYIKGDKAYEDREGEVDVTKHLNNWDMISPDKIN